MTDVHGLCRIKTKTGWPKEEVAQLMQISTADTAISIKRTHAAKSAETASITQMDGGCTSMGLNVTMALRFQEMAVTILAESSEDGSAEEEPLAVLTFARKSVEIPGISMRNFVTTGITRTMTGATLIAFLK
jgi:hypothetical protein